MLPSRRKGDSYILAKCTDCKLYKMNSSSCIPANGSKDAEVLLIVPAPNNYDDSVNRLFDNGVNVTLLKSLLGMYDLKLSDYRITSMVKCFPRKEPYTNEEIWICRHNLIDEINEMPNLKIIVAFGKEVWHCLSITNKPKKLPVALGEKRGTIRYLEEFPNIAILPTYDIAAISKNPKFKEIVIGDLKRLRDFVNGTYGVVKPVVYRNIYDLDTFDDFIIEANKHKYLAFDTETTSKEYSPKERVLCIQFSWSPYTSWYLPINEEDKPNYWGKDWEYVKGNLSRLFINDDVFKIGHNAKFDVKYVEGVLGIPISNVYFDTMLAHFLMNPDSKHDLKTIADFYTDMGRYDDGLDEAKAILLKTKEGKEQYELHGYGALPLEILRKYALCDADATIRLFEIFKPKIDSASYKNVLYGINMPAMRVFTDAEKRGICVDKELMLQEQIVYANRLADIQDFIDETIFRSRSEEWDLEEYNKLFVREVGTYTCNLLVKRKNFCIYEFTENDNKLTILVPHDNDFEGVSSHKHYTVQVIKSDEHPDYTWRELNIDSTKQVKELLFTPQEKYGLGLTPNKVTKIGNVSVDKDALIALSREIENPILNKIVEFRSVRGIKSTSIDGMLEAIDPITGNIHPNYNMHIARTGRTSCTNPNMQNVPKDSEEGGKIRNFYVPEPGNVFVDGDISQAEFRIMGEASGDKKMLELFKQDVDVHRYIASIVYNISEDQVNKVQRGNCKSIVFGAMYGESIYSLAIKLGIPEKEAQKIHDLFFDMCPDAEKWLEDQTRFAIKHKYIQNIFGRIRYLYDVDSDVKVIKEATLREAKNCVDTKTEILTKDGWKKYNEVSEGTIILTKNIDTGILEWHPIKQVCIYENYMDDLYYFTGRSFSAVCNADHRWLTFNANSKKDEFRLTKNLHLNGQSRIHRTGKYIGIHNDDYTLDEMAVVGIAVTDGSYKYSKSKGKDNPNRVYVNQCKPTTVPIVRGILERANAINTYHTYRNGTSHMWGISLEISKKMFRDLPGKELNPKFLNSLDAEQLEVLFESMMLGDGSICKPNSGNDQGKRSISCTNEYGADMFLMLLTLIGRSGRKHSRIIQGRVCWYVNIHRRDKVQLYKRILEIKNNTGETIWCPSVENESFVARREGQSYITGNTPVQSGASDYVMIALVGLYNALIEKGYENTTIKITVHDSIIVDTPRKYALEIKDIMKYYMSRPIKQVCHVPMKADVDIYDRWSGNKLTEEDLKC